MHFIADMFLAARDFIFGSLHKALATASRWTTGIFPYSAGIGLVAAFSTGDMSLLFYGAIGVPVTALCLGLTWGLATGGFQQAAEGLRTRSYHRRQHTKAHEKTMEIQPEITKSPPPLAPRPSPRSPDLAFHDSRPGTNVSDRELMGMAETCRQRGIGGCE